MRCFTAENEANEFLSTVMRPASDDPKVCNCIQLSALCSQLRTQIDQLIIDRQNLETRVRTLEQDVSQLKSRDDIVAAPSCAETSLNVSVSMKSIVSNHLYHFHCQPLGNLFRSYWPTQHFGRQIGTGSLSTSREGHQRLLQTLGYASNWV